MPHPEWVLNQKKPGTTVKKIGENYYLYYATSKRVPGKSYPVSEQVYIGKITKDGIIRERVSIDVSKTEARLLGELFENLPEGAEKVIVLKVKNEWLYTKLPSSLLRKLEERGICKNGKVIF